MKAHEIIDAYVLDVMRNVPKHQRNDIGLELRGHLIEVLESGPAPADATTALALVRSYGSPQEAAARYREPGALIVPEHQTRSFTLLAIGGVLLQWALSLPAVMGDQSLGQWWFGAGLGALWWPGFMVMAALALAWLRHKGLYQATWRPRSGDVDTINRRLFQFGLTAFAAGAAIIASLPFLIPALPQPQAGFFALDPDFLVIKAPLAMLLWLGQFVLIYAVYAAGRWTAATWRAALAFDCLWLALLAWWIGLGAVFVDPAINAFVQSILAFVALTVILSLAIRLYRSRIRITDPRP
jgi:hypothetical protein